jgi:outer membrane protein OmpA-like peptidoglycan-associated protein
LNIKILKKYLIFEIRDRKNLLFFNFLTIKFLFFQINSIFTVISTWNHNKTNMRAILILAIIILQLLLGWLLYKDQQKCCLTDEPTSIPKTLSGPILFQWAESEPVTGPGLSFLVDSLSGLVGGDQKLEIIAWYCDDEKGIITPDSIANERAQKTRLLFKNLTDEQCKLSIKEVDCSLLDKQNLFEGLEFGIRTITQNVIETENETIIYFQSNSTDKLNATDVETYLDKIATIVTSGGKKIKITGHTDNVGPEEPNLKLGLERAEIIKQHLISKGVNESDILVDSKGELMPVADNNTAEGREKNRRTVLQIIQ